MTNKTNANDINTLISELLENERLAQKMYVVRRNIDEADRWLDHTIGYIENDELLPKCNELRDLLEKAAEISISIAQGLKRDVFDQKRESQALTESK